MIRLSPPRACPQMVLHAWHGEEMPVLAQGHPQGMPKSPLPCQHFWRVVPAISSQTQQPRVHLQLYLRIHLSAKRPKKTPKKQPKKT